MVWHTRLPYPSPTPGACSTSCASQWCHPIISSSVVPFSSCLQFPIIRILSKESVLRIRWPKYWIFSFSISPFNEYSELTVKYPLASCVEWSRLTLPMSLFISIRLCLLADASVTVLSSVFQLFLSNRKLQNQTAEGEWKQGMQGPAPYRHILQGQTLSLFRRPELLPVVPSPATPCITAWSPSVLLLISQAWNVSLAKSFGGFPEPCLCLCFLFKKKKGLSNLNCNLLGNHTPPLCCQAPKWNE